MDDEPASEAIDGDVDSNDEGPDSMDLLMGEIEIPNEISNSKESNADGKISHDLFRSPCYDIPLKECELDDGRTKNTNKTDNKLSLNINSLKKCQGYPSQYVNDNEFDMAYGFIRSGELRRIIINTDPLLVPNKV